MPYKILLLIIFSFFVLGCGPSVSEDDLQHLNGYWEITAVVFPDGNKKEYRPSTIVDYFYVADKKGFRKKVYPKLDGTFSTTDDAKNFTVFEKNGWLLQFGDTAYKWEEKIILLNATELTLKNNEDIRYLYKRFQPINLAQ